MENELSRVVNAIPAFVWSAAPDGNVDFLNQRWCDYTGVKLEAASGEGWYAVIHPDDTIQLLDHWRALLESGEPGEFEARLRRFDGTYRWFLIRAVPLRDDAGRIVKWYGQNTDIEDRKRAEALLAGEKQLLEMVASGRELPIVLDEVCRLLDATAEGCLSSILLLDRSQKVLLRAIGPGLPTSYNEAIEGRTASCDAGPCGMAIISKTQVIVSDLVSETRWHSQGWPALALAHGLGSCWSTPILSVTGDSLGSFAIYRRNGGSPTQFHQELIQKLSHIATIAIERTRSEDALKRSEAFLAQAQYVSSTGGFFWYASTDEITWSEEVYRIFELDPAVPVTLELIFSRLHPEDIPSFQEMLIRQKRDYRDFEHEHRLLMPDKSVKYLHVVAHATRDEDDRLKYIAAVQDVTQRRLSEDALAKLRSELAHVARVMGLGAMTASIAHEVNQPLSGIITNASTCLRMLASDPPNVEGARETARRTIRDGNRASDVIARLRALFAKQDVSAELIDLNEATREVIALSVNELQSNRVILRPMLDDDLPPVQGDRVQLQQVILNLLRNASDAMSEIDDRPRYLSIRTERDDDDDSVRLCVQDVGVGFDPQSADRLFEPFYTTKNGGMGIGLAVSRSIIENHRGHLRATTNDGPGSTFYFSIPCGSERVASSDSPDATRTAAVTDAA